jgi:protein-disulfide isomerase
MTDERRRRLWQLGAAGLFAAIVVGVVVLVAGTSSEPDLSGLPGQARDVQRLFSGIPQHSLTLGDPKAPTTLTEYGDLQCPTCRDFAESRLPAIVGDFVKPGKLKVVFEPVSILGADSERAARLAVAAALQNRLWQFVDLFYRNQGDENSGYVTDDFLTKLARATPGLDAGMALRDRESPAVDRILRQAEAAGINTTPTFKVDPESFASQLNLG